MLEVVAGTELPWQLVCAIHLEDICSIKIEIVILSVNVVVGIRKIVTGGFIREATAKNTVLALNCESTENLPLVGQALNRGELDSVRSEERRVGKECRGW